MSHNHDSLWFTAYEQDKPLVTHVKTLNAARKLAITSNNKYLTTTVRPSPSLPPYSTAT